MSVHARSSHSRYAKRSKGNAPNASRRTACVGFLIADRRFFCSRLAIYRTPDRALNAYPMRGATSWRSGFRSRGRGRGNGTSSSSRSSGSAAARSGCRQHHHRWPCRRGDMDRLRPGAAAPPLTRQGAGGGSMSGGLLSQTPPWSATSFRVRRRSCPKRRVSTGTRSLGATRSNSAKQISPLLWRAR
jgi:hypothetical protein